MSQYAMYRVFCATTLGEEEEREAFYKVLGEVNEAVAMPAGILLVAVSLVPRMVNKLAFQHAVDENIRDSSYYIQVLADTWGPPERNFVRDYKLACRCLKDNSLPMRGVAVAVKQVHKERLQPEVADFLELFSPSGNIRELEFSESADFEEQLKTLLIEWAQTLPANIEVQTA